MVHKSLWNRVKKRLFFSFGEAVKLLRSPVMVAAKKQKGKSILNELFCCSLSNINSCLFPHLPEHYPFKKKLLMARNTSLWGVMWDIFQITLSIAGCVVYVCETYRSSYYDVLFYWVAEFVMTLFFFFDFLLNGILASSFTKYLTTAPAWIDIFIIAPVVISFVVGTGVYRHFAILRFLRLLRVARVFRIFKLVSNLSGIKRQLGRLVLILMCLVFLATGVVHLVENDVKQEMELDCKYISANTGYEPSCSPTVPASFLDDCDCETNFCDADYAYGDILHEPSNVRCHMMSFFTTFYFIIVTIATVGYGEVSPTTEISRLIVLLFILTSVVLIPMQVNQFIVLLQQDSAYRQAYVPHEDEDHVILCGYVNERPKMERFLKEFFHPDRAYLQDADYHAVILSPLDPSEDMIRLMNNGAFETRVSYLIGSALSMEDLKRARADVACAMFFLCNTEASDSSVLLDDSGTVLRTLSVSNYNPNLECLVQVMRPEDRDILRDSDVDVILCLDEFKTSLQARNAVCPGYSTYIENLFHTFGDISFSSNGVTGNVLTDGEISWNAEYLHGVQMEVYYIPLDRLYLESLSYEWTLMCEGIYLEYDVVLMGVCSASDHSICINPSPQEMGKYAYPSKFFNKYNVGVLIADEQILANAVAAGMADIHTVNRIVEKILVAEQNFACRKKNVPDEDTAVPHVANPRAHAKKGVSGAIAAGFRRMSSFGTSQRNSMIAPSVGALTSFATGTSGAGSGLFNEPSGRSAEKQLSVKQLIQATKNRCTVVSKNLVEFKKLKKARAPSTTPLESKPVSFVPSQLLQHDLGTMEEEDEELSASVHVTADDGLDSDCASSKSSTSNSYSSSGYSSSDASDVSGDGSRLRTRTSISEVPLFDDSLVNGGLALGRSAVRNAKGKKISATGSAVDATVPAIKKKLGTNENKILDSGEIIGNVQLRNHIVLFGCALNLSIFLQELRRPLMIGASYHPIVLVDEEFPPEWGRLRDTFRDLYLLKGKLTRSLDFNRVNIRHSFAVVQLASRASVTTVEGEHLDADTLFSYLKLEKYIPQNVFFTVELTAVTNMAVLNSTIMRRSRKKLRGASSSVYVMDDRRDTTRVSEAVKEQNGVAAAESSKRVHNVQKRGTFASSRRANRMSVSLGNNRNYPAAATASELTHRTAARNRTSFISSRGTKQIRETKMRKKTSSAFSANHNSVEYLQPGYLTSGADSADSAASVVRSRKSTKKQSSFLFGRSSMFSKKSESYGISVSAGDNSLKSSSTNKHRKAIHGNYAHNHSNSELSDISSNEMEKTSEIIEVNHDTGASWFWGTSDSHHTLPVFASGRAFIPSTFDSILCQSFFGVLTPVLTEKLICGQKHQTMYQVPLPNIFIGRFFVDCFRAFMSRNALISAIYRAPNKNEINAAVLPYVYTCPKPDAIMRENDKLFVFANPLLLEHMLKSFKTPLVFVESTYSYCLGDVAKGNFGFPAPFHEV